LVRYFPNNGCSCNHLLNFSDDLLNAQAARTTKNVVGTPGRSTPMYAQPTKNNPKVIHNDFFIFLFFINWRVDSRPSSNNYMFLDF
jgi:hypothetical protein